MAGGGAVREVVKGVDNSQLGFAIGAGRWVRRWEGAALGRAAGAGPRGDVEMAEGRGTAGQQRGSLGSGGGGARGSLGEIGDLGARAGYWAGHEF